MSTTLATLQNLRTFTFDNHPTDLEEGQLAFNMAEQNIDLSKNDANIYMYVGNGSSDRLDEDGTELVTGGTDGKGWVRYRLRNFGTGGGDIYGDVTIIDGKLKVTRDSATAEFVLPLQTVTPTSGTEVGSLRWNTTLSQLQVWNGAAWDSSAITSGKLSQFAVTTSAELAGIISDETGTGALVFASSPSLTTPSLGVASATSINKVAITAPATGSTLTIADGKTFTVSNTLTFTGTDASSVAFGAGGVVAYTSNKLSAFATTTSAELAGVISDETGTGALVFASSPTLVTPALGTPSSGNLSNCTNLPAGQLSGTIPSGVLGNSTVYIGTTAVVLNRGSGLLSLTGIGNIEVNADSLYDLGTTGVRWRAIYADNVYSGDLHLKNDRGDYTLIEEEDALTIRNNKTGKVYNIMMTEREV